MKAAKIISIAGGVLYLIYWVFVLYISFNNTSFNTPLITVVLANLLGLVLVVANFGYFYYLTGKEKTGEAVKNALLFGILIAGGPPLIFPILLFPILLFAIDSITSTF